MSGDSFLQRYSRRRILVVSGLSGVLLGVVLGGLLSSILGIGVGTPPGFTSTPSFPSGGTIGNFTATAFDADTEHTLRLIQAIGILLPLFTGLLRFTTSEELAANKPLLFGIFTLIIGGIVAVIGGIAADTALVLKAALVFVLFTFLVIGISAGRMLKALNTERERTDEPSSDDGVNGGGRYWWGTRRLWREHVSEWSAKLSRIRNDPDRDKEGD